jgi:hypothetical protein
MKPLSRFQNDFDLNGWGCLFVNVLLKKGLNVMNINPGRNASFWMKINAPRIHISLRETNIKRVFHLRGYYPNCVNKKVNLPGIRYENNDIWRWHTSYISSANPGINFAPRFSIKKKVNKSASCGNTRNNCKSELNNFVIHFTHNFTLNPEAMYG